VPESRVDLFNHVVIGDTRRLSSKGHILLAKGLLERDLRHLRDEAHNCYRSRPIQGTNVPARCSVLRLRVPRLHGGAEVKRLLILN
jgi:hypothetical protein